MGKKKKRREGQGRAGQGVASYKLLVGVLLQEEPLLGHRVSGTGPILCPTDATPVAPGQDLVCVDDEKDLIRISRAIPRMFHHRLSTLQGQKKAKARKLSGMIARHQWNTATHVLQHRG